MIFFPNHTRRLMVMMRGLTISPGGAPTNVQKRNLSKKPPSVIADVRPSGSAGDSATARLWIFRFRLLAVRACACLGERSEPTCIRQAHVTVPKDDFMTKKPGLYVNEGSVSLRLFAFINGQLNAISFVSLFKTRYS